MNPAYLDGASIWTTGTIIVLAIVVGSILLQIVLHRFLSGRFRSDHHEPVAAIFSIIGVTYAVLLAFIAMVTWEGFNKARAATFAEAGAVLELQRLIGAMPPSQADTLHAALATYVHNVVDREFPAQRRGLVDTSGEASLAAMHDALRSEAPNELRAELLHELSSLGAARQERLLATEPTVPGIVWAVLIAGGALLVGFSALLGAESTWLHLAMTAALGASGALIIVLIASLNYPFGSEFGISAHAFMMQPTLANMR